MLEIAIQEWKMIVLCFNLFEKKQKFVQILGVYTSLWFIKNQFQTTKTARTTTKNPKQNKKNQFQILELLISLFII